MTAIADPKAERPLIIRGDAHTPSDLVKWGHTERPGDAVNVPGPAPTYWEVKA